MSETEAQFIERAFLKPHHSRLTGDMFTSLRRWYGIEPLWTLTILGAETSLGDPRLGGPLVGVNNFGCIRAGKASTPWAKLACGVITVNDRVWWRFKTPWDGIAAWGRLIKIGPTFIPGYYLERLRAGDWRGWAKVYYGESVEGFESYLDNILHLNATFKKKLEAAGFPPADRWSA